MLKNPWAEKKMSAEVSQRTLISSTRRFFSGTILSRITGMLRDMSLAFFFGSSPLLASFMIAYRFANLLRRLLGEGSLQSGFVPHFTTLKQKSPQEAAFFFRDSFGSLFVLLLFLVVLGEGMLFFSMPFFSAEMQEILSLTRIMFPGLLFICLYALSSGYLQCEKRFFLSAVAPAAFNLLWIAAAFFMQGKPPELAMKGLAVGVVWAFCLQWLIPMVSSLYHLRPHLSFQEWLKVRIFSKQVRLLGKPLSLAVIGVAAMQVNAALDAVFAKFADSSGPAFLWYAIRIEQLPLALFGIALANALLPSLSRRVGLEDWDGFCQQIHFALSSAIVFMLGASGALFALGGCGINLLYGRGLFTSDSVVKTLFCLWGYAGSLLPAAAVLFLATGFYARKKYLVPAISSIFSVVLNLLLNTLFVFAFGWGAFSIALATTISAWFNCIFLGWYLAREVPLLFSRELFALLGKSLVAVALASLVAILTGKVLCGDQVALLLQGGKPVFTQSFGKQLIGFLIPAFLFVGTFLLSAYALKLQPLFSFLRVKKKGLEKAES